MTVDSGLPLAAIGPRPEPGSGLAGGHPKGVALTPAFVDLSSTAPGNVVTVHGKLHYPAGAHEQGHKFYWYLALNGSQRARHVTTTRVSAPFKPGWSRFTARLRTGLPPGVTYRYEYQVLTADLPHQGVGLNGCTSSFSEDRYPMARSTCTVPAHIHFAPR